MDDAFSAGVNPGGLKSSQEIKILLCYMLYTVNQAMPRDEVVGILSGDGMANYFDAEEAVNDLIRLQHLTEADGKIATTVTGGQIGESLHDRVPYTLRERSVSAALQLLKRRQVEQDNRVNIITQEDGRCRVTCTVQDREVPLLSVSLTVADKWQAEQIKEHFLADPSLLYRGTLATLTGDAEIKRGGTQLVVKLS